MNAKKITLSTILFAFILNVLMGTNVFAEHAPDHMAIYDETAYTKELDAKMDRLDKLYLLSIDKKQPASKALKAKREYFTVAREILQNLNKKFDSLHPERGAALSHTEILMINHVQIMLLDMLTSIHEAEWKSDEKIE